MAFTPFPDIVEKKSVPKFVTGGGARVIRQYVVSRFTYSRAFRLLLLGWTNVVPSFSKVVCAQLHVQLAFSFLSLRRRLTSDVMMSLGAPVVLPWLSVGLRYMPCPDSVSMDALFCIETSTCRFP